MRNIKLLLKVFALNSLGINQALHSKHRKDRLKLVGMGFLFAFVTVSLLFVFFMYDYLLAVSLTQAQISLRILPAIMMALCGMITLFTTIYKANGILFSFRDYDLQMSLPIKSSTIVASRILILYGMNLGFTLLVMLPAAAIYAWMTSPSFFFYLFFFFSLLVIPLIPIIFATILGVLISLVASRFRHTSAISVLLTFILVLGALFFSFQMDSNITDWGNISASIITSVNHIYPLTELFTQAVCEENFVSLLLFLGISILCFLLFCFIIGKSYKKINTFITTRKARSSYQMSSLKTASPFWALYKKEGKRFLSSPLYITNTAIGAALLIIAVIALLIAGPSYLKDLFPEENILALLDKLIPAIICFTLGISCSTASSISLEGKQLWIAQSLPVPAHTIFASKAAVNLSFLIPSALISSILLAFLFPDNLLYIFIVFIFSALYSLFISFLGLVLNLLFPNFNWTSEVTVIKQSVPVFLAILISMLLAILSTGSLFLFSTIPLSGILAAESILFLLADLLLWNYLKKKGSKRFHSLP